jgi:hypothetical protein
MTEPSKSDAYNRVMEGVPNYQTHDRLTVFLYLLARDHLPAADVVELLMQASSKSVLSNGYLAQFAAHCANKLRSL